MATDNSEKFAEKREGYKQTVHGLEQERSIIILSAGTWEQYKQMVSNLWQQWSTIILSARIPSQVQAQILWFNHNYCILEHADQY
jgi:hypothetical protein